MKRQAKMIIKHHFLPYSHLQNYQPIQKAASLCHIIWITLLVAPFMGDVTTLRTTNQLKPQRQ
ncbi:MAG: hypothetical protein EBT93_03785 [Alphaproteobacteria bacterium]|nr:hypothetical protein [Alphaproteobacteria bacterium]